MKVSVGHSGSQACFVFRDDNGGLKILDKKVTLKTGKCFTYQHFFISLLDM